MLRMRVIKNITPAAAVLGLACAVQAVAAPITLPGSADSSRITPEPQSLPDPGTAPVEAAPVRLLPTTPVPANAKSVKFVLRKVVINGATPLADVALDDIYSAHIGKEITLDMAWVFAGMITERYKNAGYFLSHAYVPAQTIDGGTLTLTLVEGYVHEVDAEGYGVDEPLVQEWIATLKSYRPIRNKQLESVLLRLNDLPGIAFRAVLEPTKDPNAPEGSVRLHLIGSPKDYSGSVRMDNNGSRYLGPYQLGLQTEVSFLPMHRTNLSGLVSNPTDELKSFSLHHEVAVAEGVLVEGYATRTNATPGYTLAIQDIKSRSDTVGIGAKYQWIRQRDENLTAHMAFEVRETNADILGTPLTRDHLRLLRGDVSYDMADLLHGYSLANVGIVQGLDAFGSSKSGDLNLSRGEAEPNFTKLTLSLSRLQAFSQDFSVLTSLDSQVASGPLYSSEEFGFGGQAFGRAYDSSEITGDHGVSGAVEVRYSGIPEYEGIRAMPFAYYDIGVVWNDDIAQENEASASSAGFGVRTTSDLGIGANIGVAFPLTLPVNDPLYSDNGKAPRYMFELNYNF